MFAYDVRAELDGEYDFIAEYRILKVPVMYAKWWNENNGTDTKIDFGECDYLFVNIDGEKHFLVDKDGNRVQSLSDADHSEPDSSGWFFYIVPDSDLTGIIYDACMTEEAKAKWRKRFSDEKTKKLTSQTRFHKRMINQKMSQKRNRSSKRKLRKTKKM